MSKKKTKMYPLSLKVSEELHLDIEEIAEKLRVKKHSLAIAAIEAAVKAIKKNGYKLVLPIEFEVTHTAIDSKEGSDRQPHRREDPPLEETEPRYPGFVEDRPTSTAPGKNLKKY